MIGNINHMLVEPHQRELLEEAAQARLAATAKAAEVESPAPVANRTRRFAVSFRGLLGAVVHPTSAWHRHHHAGVR